VDVTEITLLGSDELENSRLRYQLHAQYSAVWLCRITVWPRVAAAEVADCRQCCFALLGDRYHRLTHVHCLSVCQFCYSCVY